MRNITELIGKTPLLKLDKISGELYGNIYVKMENQNPGGSVKDRIAMSMLDAAEQRGFINKDTVIIEPTSGNTGIGLAMLCAVRSYKLIVVMPKSMSNERRALIKNYGAEIVLSEADKGMKGAVEIAKALKSKYQNAYIPMQFENPATWEVHYKTTGPEIWNDINENIHVFVSGVGTGGTITGVGRFMKKQNQRIKVVAVEPETSPVLSGGSPGAHKIQGIGAGFIPEIMDMTILDEIIKVSDEDAFSSARKMFKKEGISCGISTGANITAAIKLAKRPDNKNKNIVTLVCDTGERYLSTDLF